jgi:hypothetical protein
MTACAQANAGRRWGRDGKPALAPRADKVKGRERQCRLAKDGQREGLFD